MFEIEVTLQDEFDKHNKGYLKLNPDKLITPFTKSEEIVWEGTLNGKEVRILQKEKIVITIDDFEVQLFPEKYNDFKRDVLRAIKNHLFESLK